MPLTAAIHWAAVGPVLSSIAIGATIWLADRGRREARRKEEAVLLGLAEALETVVEFHQDQCGQLTSENYLATLQLHKRVGMADHFADVFDQVKITDIPTPRAAGVFVTIRAWLRRHAKDVAVWEGQTFELGAKDFRESVAILARCRVVLIEEAKRITTEFSLRYRVLNWLRRGSFDR